MFVTVNTLLSKKRVAYQTTLLHQEYSRCPTFSHRRACVVLHSTPSVPRNSICRSSIHGFIDRHRGQRHDRSTGRGKMAERRVQHRKAVHPNAPTFSPFCTYLAKLLMYARHISHRRGPPSPTERDGREAHIQAGLSKRLTTMAGSDCPRDFNELKSDILGHVKDEYFEGIQNCFGE